jgi:hypothetical protein
LADQAVRATKENRAAVKVCPRRLYSVGNLDTGDAIWHSRKPKTTANSMSDIQSYAPKCNIN